MSFLDWYLNLSFWQACLVWLKLLLPVIFGLTVFALIVISARVFSGSLKYSSGRQLLPNVVSKRPTKTAEKSVG